MSKQDQATDQKGEGMTLEELTEWHYQREGWRWVDGSDGTGWFESRDGRKSRHDPFPATLDAADASFPPDYRWSRDPGDSWRAWKGWETCVEVRDTNDKIRDLYELSMKAWEQEAA